MALESLGSLKDIVVRIRGQGEGLKQSLAQAQDGANRLRISLGGVNAAGLGGIRIYRTLGIGLAALGSIVGVGVLLHQMQSLVSQGVAFNAQLEQMTLGIKAVVAANVDVVDQTGQQITGAEQLRVVGEAVADQIEKLKTDAILTTATLEQLVQAFQGAIPPAVAVGVSLDDTRKVTTAIVQAAGAIGLPMQQVAVEVREILGGTINTHTRLAQSLRISNDMVRTWKEQGVLAQELLKRMSAFTIAGKEAGESWIGILSTLQDFKQQLLGIAVGPAQERFRQLFVDFRDSLGEVRGGVFVFRKEVLDFFTTAASVLKTLAELVIAFGGALMDVVRLLLAVTGLGELFRVLIQSREGILLLAQAVIALGAALALVFLGPVLGPIVAGLTLLVGMFTSLRFFAASAGDALQQTLQPMKDLAKAAEDQEKVLRREAEALETAAAALADDAIAHEQKREIIAALAKDYDEFLPFLLDENRATADAVPLIKARVAALKEQAAEQRKIRIGELRAQEAALEQELERRRRLLEPGAALPEADVAAAKKELATIERTLRETAGKRRTLEVEVKLLAKPKEETEPQRKIREKLELERRKTALADLQQVQEDAQVELETQRGEFALREDVAFVDRQRKEEEFLQRKQEIERTKVAITIDGLKTEAKLLEEKVGKEKEAEAQLLAVKRDIAGKEADLVNLVKKQRIDALQAVRDKEKQLRRERDQEALGLLGELQKRLEQGPLEIALPGAGRLFQTETITAETKLTPEQRAAAFAAMRAEEQKKLEELQAGRGLTVPEMTRLVELQKSRRERAEREKELGGEEAIFGAALGGGGFVQAQLAGFGTIQEKAKETFTKTRELFLDQNALMIADSKEFQALFPEVLFEGFYGRLVKRLRDEFGRQ